MRRWRSIVAGNRRAILAAMFALIRLWHHAILAAGGLMDRTVDRGDGLRTGGNSSCTECIADVRQTAAGRSVRAAPGQRQAAHPEPDGRSRPHLRVARARSRLPSGDRPDPAGEQPATTAPIVVAGYGQLGRNAVPLCRAATYTAECFSGRPLPLGVAVGGHSVAPAPHRVRRNTATGGKTWQQQRTPYQ
jgi:hypothetical protein